MAVEHRTDKSIFQSKYGGGYLTPAKYLAEMMCERTAKRDGKTLRQQFWKEKEWLRVFMLELKYANQLLEAYSFQSLLAALADRKCEKTYSLRAYKYVGVVAKEYEKKKVAAESNLEVTTVENDGLPENRTVTYKKNLLGDLE